VLPGEEEALALVGRSRKILEQMHEEDREEAIDLHERIGAAIKEGDAAKLATTSRALRELLFFMEGRPN
jgi:DNA-binding FadR family transcriptional regulator